MPFPWADPSAWADISNVKIYIDSMEPQKGNLAAFLKGNITYLVPPFQRPYQWEELQWFEIANNSLEVYRSPKTDHGLDREHWLGIQLVSVPEGGIELGQQTWELIDGQQRLITMIMWLHALRDHARDLETEGIQKDPIAQMANVVVQRSDEPSYAAVIKNQWRSFYESESAVHGPLRAYVYFRYLLWGGMKLIDEVEPPKLPKFKKLAKNAVNRAEEVWSKSVTALEIEGGPNPVTRQQALDVIQTTLRCFTWLQLQRQQTDAPAAVLFSALNGDGLKLRPFDFVRNSLFVKLPQDKAQQIYTKQWEEAEARIVSASWSGKRFDAPSIFLYDFLIATGASGALGPLNRARGNEHFAAITAKLSIDELGKFLEEDFVPAMDTWLKVVTASSQRPSKLSTLIAETRALSAGPLDPALLYLLEALRRGHLAEGVVITRIRQLQALVVRMLVGDKPLNNLRSKIMNVMPHLANSYSEVAWKKALEDIGWCSDKEILETVVTLSLYGNKAKPNQLLLLFRGIEIEMAGLAANGLVGGRLPESYSIEHLLPSSRQDHWVEHVKKQKMDYEEAFALKDTLGNLTPLTNTHNKRVGTKLLADKAACLEDGAILGYREPLLRVHESWATKENPKLVWNHNSIRERSMNLAKKLLKHWPIA